MPSRKDALSRSRQSMRLDLPICQAESRKGIGLIWPIALYAVVVAGMVAVTWYLMMQ
jgi:hypothetical protein